MKTEYLQKTFLQRTFCKCADIFCDFRANVFCFFLRNTRSSFTSDMVFPASPIVQDSSQLQTLHKFAADVSQ